MTEYQAVPEGQEVLAKATHVVVGLYLGDQLSVLLGTQGEAQRDKFWQETAQEFPTFGEKIIGLRQALKIVAETKKAYAPVIADTTKLPFMELSHREAQLFLGDVLFSRMTHTPGYLDYALDPVAEAQSMASEMGLEQGWRGEQAKGVTLEASVGKVLQGALRVTHQSS